MSISWADYFDLSGGYIHVVDDFGNLVAISPTLFNNFGVYFGGFSDGH